MASHLNPPLKHRTHSFFSEPMQFQRGKGKIKTKKIQRKIKLKFKHILFSFLLLGGIFYSIQQFYLFLISWDNLDIKEIEIASRKPKVKEEIQLFFEGKNLGNLLLLDIGHLQDVLSAHRWVKEVRVRKILPSTLKIEIKERTPVALLKKGDLYLIDEEGVLLKKIERREEMNLPLLFDLDNFQKEYKEKLKLAWKCLHDLSPSQRERIEVLDLTEYENITVQLKKEQTRLILGDDQFSQKLKSFQESRAAFKKYGDLEYVDLRIPDRFYIKPKKNSSYRDLFPNLKKEAY